MLLGTRIKLQIALHSLIRKYLLFLAANKKKLFCWNPQDFNFASITALPTVFPSWPQSLCSVEFLLNGKLIEQLWKREIVPAQF